MEEIDGGALAQRQLWEGRRTPVILSNSFPISVLGSYEVIWSIH